MARLANAIKMGYFRTPASVIERIASWLTFEPGQREQQQTGWRLLDPCAGRGEATELLDDVDGPCESWGVELSPKRAQAAAERMDRVFNAAWRETRVARESVSLLWLNPPYDVDYDGENRRLEIEFLRTAAPALMDGGILIYIVPRHLLGYEGAARRLAGHFQDLVVRRFPEGAYERFKQVVVFGRKRPYKTPTGDRVDGLRRLREESIDIPSLDEGPQPPWPLEIPVAPEEARFRRVSLSRREQIARAHSAGWPEGLLEAMEYREQVPFRPAIVPKKGHISMIMSSGAQGITRVRKNGQTLVVKGRTFKEAVKRTETSEKGEEVQVITYRPKTTVGKVSDEGVEVLDEVEDLKTFMESYGDALAEQILHQNEPLYDLDPPSEDWDHLGTLSRDREPLPGQKEAGLLPVQKHVAITMKRALRRHGSALIQGEMGCGKTTVALATIDLLDAYPAVVLCPPHMVDKWRREAREVIPGVQTRELRRIGKTASMEHEVNDVRAFVEDWKAGQLGRKAIAVVASTAAKLGPGWEGAAATRYTLPLDDPEAEVDRRAPFRKALKDYQEARERLTTLKHERVSQGELAEQRELVRTLRRAALDEAVAYPVCPVCGRMQMEGPVEERAPIWRFKAFDKKPRSCNRSVQGWARDEDGLLVTDDDGDRIWIWDPEEGAHAPVCGSRLYQFGSRYRRWPIADYVKDQAADAFVMLVVDEIHHYKGKSSDRGVAFARMVDAIPLTLGLTGTIYGGKASDIYWLLYRLGVKDLQQVFPYHSARKWVDMYGVLEERIYGKNGGSRQYGAYNANTRYRKRVTERPGVSPGILRYLIDNTVFLSLKDLGIGLPPYKEELAVVGMTDEQRGQYREMTGQLKGLALEDTRYLSLWLQRSLGRPNTGFRYEEVIKTFREGGEVVRRQHLMHLPAVVDEGELLPKEQWLVDYAQAEADQDRKVLVYARQTGEYDIQPRLEHVLEEAGLRAGVLTRSVGTREREAWVEQHAPGLDALIVNPRLVETGLDLVQFSTVVFYEISYSLFTMWQAMRRVWRLGQQRPVKVVFTAYQGAMEMQALALMGQKMGAAQLLYGDQVTGAIVPEDAGDFLTELANAVLEDKELPDLEALFTEAQPTTASAMGSPTARSPRLRFHVELRRLWKEMRDNGGRRRRRIPDEQMALL